MHEPIFTLTLVSRTPHKLPERVRAVSKKQSQRRENQVVRCTRGFFKFSSACLFQASWARVGRMRRVTVGQRRGAGRCVPWCVGCASAPRLSRSIWHVHVWERLVTCEPQESDLTQTCRQTSCSLPKPRGSERAAFRRRRGASASCVSIPLRPAFRL